MTPSFLVSFVPISWCEGESDGNMLFPGPVCFIVMKSPACSGSNHWDKSFQCGKLLPSQSGFSLFALPHSDGAFRVGIHSGLSCPTKQWIRIVTLLNVTGQYPGQGFPRLPYS